MKSFSTFRMILFWVFIVFLIVGCGGGTKTPPSTSSQVTIYTGGDYSDSGHDHIPCYWDYNGVKHNLPVSAGYDYEVTSIFISHNNVYVGGFNHLSNHFACYWDNTGEHKLPVPSEATESHVNSIFIKDNTVYACGYYKIGTKDVACYWINTSSPQVLGSGTYLHAHANSIFVDNVGRVYVGGDIGDGDDAPNPCYWANSLTPSTLPVAAGRYAKVKFIYAYNNDVYSCGVDHPDNRFFSYYWLNNTIKSLAVPDSFIGHVTSIFVNDNSVYAGGYYSNSSNTVVCYWDNAIRHDLEKTYDSLEKTSISILVKNNTIYVGGIKSGSSGDRAYYWDDTGGHCVYRFPQYHTLGFCPVFLQ